MKHYFSFVLTVLVLMFVGWLVGIEQSQGNSIYIVLVSLGLTLANIGDEICNHLKALTSDD